MKCEDLEKVVVGDDPERFFQIGAQMPLLENEQLVDLLRRNVDVFTLDAYEAPEVFYPQWLPNTVVVKKKTGKWRVCVDFTDLNKACLKTLSLCLV